ncbi:MAG: glycosyltransferase [Gammaproteobacteria bacterium]|nr:glycosyltransferase [Gammaproteobacteria bacterium]
MKILLLVRSLAIGGAERQLVLLARGLAERDHAVHLLVFYSGGELEPDLEASGITLHALNKRGRWDNLGFARRLVRLVREIAPDVAYGCMDVPNVLLALLRGRMGDPSVVWGVRSAFVDYSRYDWSRRAINWLETRVAGRADQILVNSRAGMQVGAGRGFAAGKLRLVANGIDTQRFRPNPGERQRQRASWGIGPAQVLVGMVARQDPIKDHEGFLAAAARLGPEFRIACIGGEPGSSRDRRLRALAQELGVAVIWQPALADTAPVFNALDLLCSASLGEGFANVIAEAMACGTPVVATDVGDSAWIIGDTGELVPAQDPEALAAGIEAASRRLREPGRNSGDACRERIESRFSVASMVTGTEAVLREAIARP